MQRHMRSHFVQDTGKIPANSKCSGSGMATPRFPIVRKKLTSEDLRRRAELHKMLDESEADSDNPELTNESSSDDEEEDVYLWERFVMSCNRGKGMSIFEWLEGIIELYMWSEKDELFQKLMQDVENAKRMDYSLSEAFDFAVHNNKDRIVSSVSNCPSDGEDFWCALSSRDVQDGCKWFSGDDCNCDECRGRSLIKKVRSFVKTFYGMQNDDVMQDILTEVNERGDETVDDAIEQSLQSHKEEILERYDKACNLIEACNIMDNPNRPKYQWKSEEDDEE